MKLTRGPFLTTSLDLVNELELRVNLEVAEYWTRILCNGDPVPKEVDSPEALRDFRKQMRNFHKWVRGIAERVLAEDPAPGQYVNIVGIGSGGHFGGIAHAANTQYMGVRAYDISKVAVKEAQRIIECLPTNLAANEAHVADVETVCAESFMVPGFARYLFLVRILEALNKPANDPQKMERTLKNIGKMMDYLRVVVIGARPEDNVGVEFSNTQPVPIETITGPMQEAFGAPILATELGNKFRLCNHVYTAHLLTGEPK